VERGVPAASAECTEDAVNQHQLVAQDQQVVVGRAPDADRARRIAQTLQHHGVDASDVRLTGSNGEPAPRRAPDLAAHAQIDGLAVGQPGRKAEAGALIGALVGAAVGAAGGLLATAGNIGRDLSVFLAIVFVFTGLGAWVAACISAARSMGYDDRFEPTDDPTDESTWVAVRVRDDRGAAQARDLLTRGGFSLVDEHSAGTRGVHPVRW
jgi:hypothetical protein